MERNYKREIEIIRKTVRYYLSKGYSIPSYDEDDLVSETFLHFFEAGFFEKYDSSITSYQYFVARATSNYLQNLSKREKLRFLSLDRTLSDDSEETYVSTLEDTSPSFTDVLQSKYFIRSIIDRLPAQSVSPSYNLSYRALFKALYVNDLRPKDVSSSIGITVGRVSQLQKELNRLVRIIIMDLDPEMCY